MSDMVSMVIRLDSMPSTGVNTFFGLPELKWLSFTISGLQYVC